MPSEEKNNPGIDAPVPERLCNARTKILDEKLNSVKKSIYIAFTVSMVWVTVLELILNHFGVV